MPTPYEAATILQSFLGHGAKPRLGQDQTLELARLREQRQAELQDRARAGDPRAAAELEGPGGINEDIAGDISTGEAPRAEIGKSLAAQHAAELAGYGSPQEQAAAARQVEQQKINAPIALEKAKSEAALTQAQQNFRSLQELMGGNKPPVSPVGTGVVAPNMGTNVPDMGTGSTAGLPVNPVTQHAAQIEHHVVPEHKFKMGVNASGAPSLTQEPTPKLSAAGVQSISSLAQAYDIASRARQLMVEMGADKRANEARESAANAEKGGALSQAGNIMGQLVDIGKAKVKRGFYGMGGIQADPRMDKLISQMEQAKVLASRGMLGGMRNWQWIQQIQDHLAQGQLPDAANLARIDNFLETAPSLVDDIYRIELNQEPINTPASAGPQYAETDANGMPR